MQYITVMIFVCCLSLVAWLTFVVTVTESSQLTYNYSVATSSVLREIEYPFYGFTFDFWKNEDSGGKWYPNASILTLDLSNENLIALTKELSPAILRIGGSPQDSVVYDIFNECSNDDGLPGYGCSQTTNSHYYGCITKNRWNEIIQFAKKTNITLVFGLNACYGRQAYNESMNFTNIINLIKYTNTMDTDDTSNLFGFEFGNELQNNIEHDTYANDFYTLFKILKNKSINTNNINFKLIGNDDYSSTYTSDFLSDLNEIITNDKTNNYSMSDVLYRLTYHHYPNCGYPGSDSVFDLSCLESIHSEAQTYSNMVNEYENIIAWMGEGSEHSGGGTPNVSNTMIDNFYYIYQLGNILTYGIYGTIRSDLTGGDYELIDHLTFEPNPDYWMLYMWKYLIGNKLYQTQLNPSDENVRVFAYSMKNDNDNENSIQSLVLTAINFDLENSARIFVSIDDNDDGSEYTCQAYYIEPKGNTIQTRMIYVNDVLMQYQNGQFPKLESVQANSQYIDLDPARLGFFVFTKQTKG